MKVKITDFLITMGKICREHNNCKGCLFNIDDWEENHFNGCIRDNLSNQKYAEIAKRIVLERMKKEREYNEQRNFIQSKTKRLENKS